MHISYTVNLLLLLGIYKRMAATHDLEHLGHFYWSHKSHESIQMAEFKLLCNIYYVINNITDCSIREY